MYCLRLFIVVLQEVHCLLHYICGVFFEKYVYIKFHRYCSYMTVYCNVWPEAVYTETTLFTKLFTCLYD